MTIEFYHYSRQPVTEVYSCVQDSLGPGVYKPKGLWLSVENTSLQEGKRDSWYDWCQAESFGIGPLRHRVKLNPDANVLWLTDPGDIDRFTMKWTDDGHGRFYRGVRWGDVAKHYAGIIIAPYQWSRRMTDHTFWYYGWDCASGCIWNKDAIESIGAG